MRFVVHQSYNTGHLLNISLFMGSGDSNVPSKINDMVRDLLFLPMRGRRPHYIREVSILVSPVGISEGSRFTVPEQQDIGAQPAQARRGSF